MRYESGREESLIGRKVNKGGFERSPLQYALRAITAAREAKPTQNTPAKNYGGKVNMIIFYSDFDISKLTTYGQNFMK